MNEVNRLKKIVLTLLSKLDNASSDELINYLLTRGYVSSDAKNMRKVLSQLIREGVIAKIPSTEKRKFTLRLAALSSRSYPEQQL